jgi:hypothetical protein
VYGLCRAGGPCRPVLYVVWEPDTSSVPWAPANRLPRRPVPVLRVRSSGQWRQGRSVGTISNGPGLEARESEGQCGGGELWEHLRV